LEQSLDANIPQRLFRLSTHIYLCVLRRTYLTEIAEINFFSFPAKPFVRVSHRALRVRRA